jgi:hypothetical protein
MIMRTFDLEAAKAGAAVCTRSGKTARVICYDRRGSVEGRVMALLNEGQYESVEFYTDNGELIPDETTQRDLMMRDDDYEYKLARGEYGPTVKENLTVDTPTCKDSLPVDREYWRRVYAGEAMAARLASSGSWCMNETVKGAVEMADALLAELEK